MSEAVSRWLVDAYALSTVVLLASAAAMATIRQPARRLAVAGATLGGLVTLLAAAALPGWPRSSPLGLPGPPPAPRPAAAFAPAATPAVALAEAAFPPVAPPAPATIPAPSPPVPSDLGPIAARVFLAGSTLTLGWLALGAWRLAALRRGSRRAPAWAEAALARLAGGAKSPALLVADNLRQPAAVGWRRPAIVLPSRFLGEPADRLEAALAHEWAHVRNGDLRRLALSRLLLPALFAHPLYWLLRARIRADQEAVADASAAAVAGRLGYAEALLAWSKSAPEGPWTAAGGSVALFERPSQIKRRIAMLLDAETSVDLACPARWRRAARLVAATAVLAASLLTVRPPAAAAPADEPAGKVEIIDPTWARSGEGGARILDPAGRPFAGATVYRTSREMVFGMGLGPWTTTRIGATDGDGFIRYARPPRGLFRSRDWIVAAAEGFGPALLGAWDEGDEAVGRLVRDDVPIRGRVIDQEGRPVPGAEVVVETIFWNPAGNLVDEWVEAMKKPRSNEASPPSTPSWNWSCGHAAAIFFPPAATDDDGRFIIRGVGRDRPVRLEIRGEALRPNDHAVVTREMPPIRRLVGPAFDEYKALHGATCELVVQTGTVAVGTVVDDADGRPIAGAKVWLGKGSSDGSNSTITDRQGRYRLEGIPPRPVRVDFLSAERRGDDPYPAVTLPLGPAEGVRPIRLDFRLRRGGR